MEGLSRIKSNASCLRHPTTPTSEGGWEPCAHARCQAMRLACLRSAMAIRSHGRGRGGTVGHGRLEESGVPSGAFFRFRFCNTWHCNEPRKSAATSYVSTSRTVCSRCAAVTYTVLATLVHLSVPKPTVATTGRGPLCQTPLCETLDATVRTGMVIN